MTASADHAAAGCRACSPGALDHGAGPWLVLVPSGTGTTADETLKASVSTESLVADCHRHGVAVELAELSADRPLSHNLSYFPGLVLIGPTRCATETLAPIANAIRRYRGSRPKSHVDLVAGAPWYEVGILQAVGPTKALHDPRLATALRDVDVRLEIDARRPRASDAISDVDLFRVFRDHLSVAEMRGRLAAMGLSTEVMAKHVEVLEAWGITAEQSADVLDIIYARRELLEDPGLPAMYRPVPNVNMNRLALILDSPNDSRYRGVVANWEQFKGAGARACREMMDEIEAVFPNFHRPRSGPHLQRDIRELRNSLWVVAQQMRRMQTVADLRPVDSDPSPGDGS